MVLDRQQLKAIIYDPKWTDQPRELLRAVSTYHFPIPEDRANPYRDRRTDVIEESHPVRKHDKGEHPQHVVYVFVDHRPEEAYTRVLYVGETESIGRTLDYLYKKGSSSNVQRDQFYRVIKESATELYILLLEGGRAAGRDIEQKLTFALKPPLYRGFVMATWHDIARYRIPLPD